MSRSHASGPPEGRGAEPTADHLKDRRGVVLVVSSSAACGRAQDLTGPLLRDWLSGHGLAVDPVRVVADGPGVAATLRELTVETPESQRPRVIITSGGTGLNSDDVTPEATAALVEREVPGIMHALWARGLGKTPTAVMSRGVAGHVGATFIVNLPGSGGGVKDGMAVLDPLLDHISAQLEDVHGHGPRQAGPGAAAGTGRAPAVPVAAMSPGRAATPAGEHTVPIGEHTPGDAVPVPGADAAGASRGRPDGGRGAAGGTVVHAVVTEQPLDPGLARAAVADRACGAVVGFSGLIRNHDGGRDGVIGLEYSAHPDAGRVMAEVAAQIAAEHPAVRLWVAHRVGSLEVGDSALEAVAASAHRAEAFAACDELVERVKARVPIWKRQRYTDGTHSWVGLDE